MVNLKKMYLALIYLIVILFFNISFADTHKTVNIGPGVIHHDVYIEEGPWAIHVLEVDLMNPFIRIETIKANNQLIGRSKTSDLAKAITKKGHLVIGAINGDFFSTSGVPHGIQVSNGQLISEPYSWTAFALSSSKEPFIDIFKLNAKIISDEGYEQKIDHINNDDVLNHLCLYNHFYGNMIDCDSSGLRVGLKPVNNSYSVNDTISLVINSVDSLNNNTPISGNGFVLNANGKSKNFIRNYAALGDTWKVVINFIPKIDSVDEAINGGPRIIRDGKISVENSREGIRKTFATDRHPRSAIGFSKNKQTFYLVTVDGRQKGYSVGMSLHELGKFLVSFGLYQAVNLDGGGSTAMVVRDKIVNRPSDKTGERPVANAILIVSNAPVSNVANLNILDDSVTVFFNKEYQFKVKAFDNYYNEFVLGSSALNWNCDEEIGAITKRGLFQASNTFANGYVRCHLGGLVDSVYINISKVSKIITIPSSVVLGVGQKQEIDCIAFDQNGIAVQLPSSSYIWSVNSDIGEFSENGVFNAKQSGEGVISVSLDSVMANIPVFVGGIKSVVIEDFNDISDWNISGLRIDLSQSEFCLEDSIFGTEKSIGKLTYKFEKNSSSIVYCNTDLPISGQPGSISMLVYGNGHKHWLRGEIVDRADNKFLLDFTQQNSGINWSDSWKLLTLRFMDVIPSWANSDKKITFPVRLKKIYLAKTGNSAENKGTIFFDDIKANYINGDIDSSN